MNSKLESISKSLASSNRSNGPSIKASIYNKLYSFNPTLLNPQSDFAKHIPTIFYNLCPGELYKYALMEDKTLISSTGALVSYSGIKTGRSPKDKRVVYDKSTQDIWWDGSSPNIKMDETTFMINRETAICYLNNLDNIFVFDGFAGWDTNNRIKVRIICERAYHALFINNMLIRPTKNELENFGDPDYTIYNAGKFPCNRFTGYMTSSTTVDLNFTRREIVILGTQYAGEMKKAIFSVMHYLMPQKNILSLHSSANELDGSSTLFFGLSGTGKTTLSADPSRKLIGDDEHCWSDSGISNIEGGCYAKCIGLSREKEPEIWDSIKFGAILENVVVDDTNTVDYDDSSLTQNTRVAFPINYNKNAKIPCIGTHPNNIILLTCDAFGVLPPVSKLNNKQLMYYFISGYTSKIAGTEDGITEPEATFSACFGEAFIVWDPLKYAKLLEEKIEKHKCNVWLINTGWLGGSYGVGSRCKLKYTREIINAIHNNTLCNMEYKKLPIFNLEYPTDCSNIDTNILNPRNLWEDKDHYDKLLRDLGERFITNFKKYDYKELESYGPQL